MSLVEALSADQRTTISDDAGTWRQFVLDHIRHIRTYARLYEITPEVMNLYRYDLRRFLKYRLNHHEDLTWIVQLLNEMPNDFSFVDVTQLYVPEDRFMTELYSIYNTITANAQ